MIRHQTILCNGIRAVEHNVARFIPIGDAFIGSVAVGIVVAFADAVHTACASTVDSAEDVVFLSVAGRQNLE